ncbi:MAG: hypothetical protein JEZ00_06405 [Anaerolineaceae bacterium]|nr:hypothetical protein [Anaerolineaceae bacterium]
MVPTAPISVEEEPQQVVNIETPTPTATIVATSTPTNTPDPILNASEMISVFETYDDFEGPFDEEKWVIQQQENNNPFSYSADDGKLQIHSDGEQFGYAELYLHVMPTNLSKDLNGVSVVFSPSLTPNGSSPYGILISLTDGDAKWAYRCYTIYSANRLYCEMEDANSGVRLFTMESVTISSLQAAKLKIEWIPHSGLLLTFLNNQLVDSQQLDITGSMWAEDVALYVYRGASYASGEILFQDFRLGEFQETVFNLPDDLLPEIEQTFLYTKDGIDYYLYDDFDSALYDNGIDFRRWKLYIEDQGHSTQTEEPFMGQQNGQFVLIGKGNVSIDIKNPQKDLSAFQVELLPQEVDRKSGSIFLSLPVWNSPRSEGKGKVLLSYVCNTNFEEGPDEIMWCTYAGENDQFIYSSFVMPIPEDELQQIRLQYNKSLGEFQAYINNQLVDQIEVQKEHQNIIDQYGFAPSILAFQSEGNNIAFDNIVIGKASASDTDIQSEPVEMTEPDDMLPHSDLYLYDDFEDENADFAWQSHLWGSFITEDESAVIYQNNGALLISDFLQDGYPSGQLHSNLFTEVHGQQPNAMKIEFQADENDFPYSRGFGLTMFILNKEINVNEEIYGAKVNLGELICRIGYVEKAIGGECSVCFEFAGCRFFKMQQLFDLTADVHGLHSIAVEHDVESSKYYMYFDDELYDVYDSPSDFSLPHIFTISPTHGEETRGTVRIENVWLGIPAQHPEVLKINEESDLSLEDNNSMDTTQAEISQPEMGLQLSIDGGSVEDGSILFLPKGTQDHRVIYSYLPENNLLAEVNMAGITLSPVEIAPNGWDTYVVFSDTGGQYQLICITRYNGESSYFQCNDTINDTPNGFQSEEISIDPEQAHRVVIEVDPETYNLHVWLDEENVFDVDSRQPRQFFEENRFNFRFMVFNAESTAQDFRMRVEDIEIGSPEY